MNNGGIVGKFLYFWIFMIGVLLFAKYLGHVDDGRHMVYVCHCCSPGVHRFHGVPGAGQKQAGRES